MGGAVVTLADQNQVGCGRVAARAGFAPAAPLRHHGNRDRLASDKMNSTNDRSRCILKQAIPGRAMISISIIATPQDAPQLVQIGCAHAPWSLTNPKSRHVILLKVSADGSRRTA